MDDKVITTQVIEVEPLGEKERMALDKITGGKWKKYGRVALAALGGVPWVGSLMSVAATISAEKDQDDINKIMFLWVQEHESKLKELSVTLGVIFQRFDSLGEEIQKRIESKEYLTLVRKTFRLWDQSETQEKKDMLRKLIINAGGLSLSQDDLVRLFLDWIEKYHEFHFMVIREIYKNPGITRYNIWINIRGEIPKDNSWEADLFRLLISDLNIGRVIRQDREVNYAGQFVKQASQKGSKPRSDTMETAFEDTKPYVLTELGSQFVHYVMDDLAAQIEGKK